MIVDKFIVDNLECEDLDGCSFSGRYGGFADAFVQSCAQHNTMPNLSCKQIF